MKYYLLSICTSISLIVAVVINRSNAQECPCQVMCAEPFAINIPGTNPATCRVFGRTVGGVVMNITQAQTIWCNGACVGKIPAVPNGETVDVYDGVCNPSCSVNGCNVIGDPNNNVEEAGPLGFGIKLSTVNRLQCTPPEAIED